MALENLFFKRPLHSFKRAYFFLSLVRMSVYDVDNQLQDGAEGGECALGGPSASQPRQH